MHLCVSCSYLFIIVFWFDYKQTNFTDAALFIFLTDWITYDFFGLQRYNIYINQIIVPEVLQEKKEITSPGSTYDVMINYYKYHEFWI